MSGWRWLAVFVVLTAASIGIGSPGSGSSQAAPTTAPRVTIAVPPSPRCPCLRGAVVLSAVPTASEGRTIASVEFQFSPAEANNWTTIGSDATAPFTASFDTRSAADGLYDVRAVATDSAGESQVALMRDNVVANSGTTGIVTLTDPGEFVNGTTALSASVVTGGPIPIRATFEVRHTGNGDWTPIPTVAAPGPGTFRTKWNTSDLPDGSYDLRVVAADDANPDDPSSQPDLFLSAPRRERHVDNTAPTSTVTVPAGPLRGEVVLAASADDAGSGVGGVKFERSVSGTGTWRALPGACTSVPCTQSFDTRVLDAGRYDFRVVARDVVGNSAASPAVRNVEVANPGLLRPDKLSIENVVAPAHDLKMLGTIGGSDQHEAWAIGVSSARAAVGLSGARLAYTAPGNQIVLLRYTDASGWQIADVLRDADGTPFAQVAGANFIGQITASGEAWVALSQHPEGRPLDVALFHRVAGGRFLRDQAATDPARPGSLSAVLIDGIDNTTSMRLGQARDGRVYGVIVAPARQGRDFGLLSDGTWTKRTASLPPSYIPNPGDRIVLGAADATGPGTGWAALSVRSNSGASSPLILARFDGDSWTPVARTGLDALDLTGGFASRSLTVRADAVRADGDGVWLDAAIGGGRVVARYDATANDVTRSWCRGLNPTSAGCAAPLDADHPAELPDAIFDTPRGKMALALAPPTAAGFVHVFANGDWTKVAAPGFSQPRSGGRASFSAPNDGWLAGDDGLGRVTAQPTPDSLARWPQPNRSPLTSVALPPGGTAGVGASGALAVGLDGTALRYDAAAGWLVDATPQRARSLALRGVAFSGPSTAFAVGQLGTILRWDGASWSEDPQSTSLTQSDLNAVAFAPGGDGWAVGRFGTILHFDGSSWSRELPPHFEAGPNLTSVTVAGADVFAVSDGNLIERHADGRWLPVARGLLPADLADDAGDLRLLAGLPDGGVVAAGRSTVIVRQQASRPFENSDQPLEGIAVALAAFRDPAGDVRAFVSLAPPVRIGGRDVDPGFPAGDGNLMRQTSGGWEDLSRALFPSRLSLPGDGVVKPDPVLAIATDPSGGHAWAVGGYAGTESAAGLGTRAILPQRAPGWRTAQIWRYDNGGSTPSPALRSETASLPAKSHTVSFAFFSNAGCRSACVNTRDAQPSVNLGAAAKQIAAFASQPGGPAFAVLGGNAVGPTNDLAYKAGTGAFDFTHLPDLLSPLGGVPLFAAHGPRDDVPQTASDPAQPWADAFARAPAPFGPADSPAGFTPAGSGSPIGAVNRYYAFDASQNGGRLRVIVLDGGDNASPAQIPWLASTLADAEAAGLPVVVISGRPLASEAADSEIVDLLSGANVAAVFAGSDVNEKTPLGSSPIAQYKGGALGYQSTRNNGVVWYFVSVDTSTGKAAVVAIPVIDSLALKPLLGLSTARSSTLAFEAVGRRPPGSLATTTSDDPAKVQGFDNYAVIPAPPCERPPCTGVPPTYSFTSSDPTIGDFVQPSGPRSRFPKLDANGRTIPSSASGLFCGYNSGETTVSVTTGLLRASLPVTVLPGGFGRPCGTVFREGVGNVVVRQSSRESSQTARPASAAAPPPTPAATPATTPAVLPHFAIAPAPQQPPVPQRPAPPAPQRPAPQVPAEAPPPVPQVFLVPPLPIIAVPPIPTAAQPVPPGGSASAQAAARKKEKARKQASQSAFTTRPASVPGTEWFYPAVGGVSVLAMLVLAGGLRAGPRRRPRPQPALLTLGDPPRGGARWRP